MNTSADVVVVGGGIIGTAAAAFLAGDGATVLLVEREGLASGASGANAGLVQHPFDPVLAPLYVDTIALYRELSSAGTGFTLPAEPAGMLFASMHRDAARHLAMMITDAFPSLAPEVVGGESLQEVEPALGANLWACWVRIGYSVVPAASTYAYASLGERRGATLRLGHEAILEVTGDTVVGVRIQGNLVTAGAVLLAAGPWTSRLVDPSGRWAPISRRWGVVVEVMMANPPHVALEEAGDQALFSASSPAVTADPDADGGVLPSTQEVDFSLIPHPGVSAVGSTFLAEEPDPRAWIEPILARAVPFLPRITDAPIRGVRACARPHSVDGRPLIGPVPGRRRLFICAGHGPWGISTGPASARLVADLILGRSPAISPAFNPARFGTPPG
jgi:D-hydroxyproline dehydrogenase subunit beta